MKSVRLISMTDEVDYSSQHSLSTAWEWMMHRQARPILRPMSDLTKEITHRGEKFVPILALDKLNCFPISDTDKALRYYDKLNEWMFDYRGLISAGLAIDVNTLPENPYER